MARETKYTQVVEWVAELIRKKELQPGDKLKSEKDICSMFDVSRQTVRHALSILVRDGLIESRQGSGSYVKAWGEETSPTIESRTIVVVSTYVNSYIFPSVIQGMEQVLEKNDWHIQIMFTYNNKETERKILKKLLRDSSLGGVIVEPTMSGLPNYNSRYFEKLKKKGIPILFFHSYYEGLDIPHMSLDDRASGRIAAEYLLSRGHRRIGGIFKLDDGQGHRRYEGYFQGLEKYGVALREKHIVWLDTEDQSQMEFTREKILKRLEKCTACVCYNDTVAHYLTAICQEEGIRVPEDLSIVSIDNSELADLNSVPLTSVKHPMEELGIKTAENMLKLIHNPDFQATYEFVPELVIRGSVKKLNTQEN